MDNGNIIIYQSEDGSTRIDVRMEQDTVWLSQQQLCELYQTSKSNVSEHIKHIFEDGELERELVVRKFRTTTLHGAIEGKTQSRDVLFYNLDMIISLGYRIRSKIATHFRRWATERLKVFRRFYISVPSIEIWKSRFPNLMHTCNLQRNLLLY